MKIIEGTPEEIREYENKENGRLDQYLNSEPEVVCTNILHSPDKVTFKWLKEHVPVELWLTLASIIFVVFTLGIQASKLTLIKEIFDIKECNNNKTVETPSINNK